MTTTFIESECEIGGSLCPIWNDWLWWQVDFVQRHPRAASFAEITDDDKKMDAEDELTEELRLTGELPDYQAPICGRASCLRAITPHTHPGRGIMTDSELVEFAKEFRDGILDSRLPSLMCFAVSAPLVTLLNMYGVKAELVESDIGWCNHFWLRLEDGRALDPTADQFNYLWDAKMPPVYLGPPTKYHGAETG